MGFADVLDGKKTIIAGVVISVINSLVALGVKLPFDPSQVTVATVTSVLGAVVILCRLLAKKPGALAPKPAA